MSNWNACPNGNENCDFSLIDELALTHKILGFIARVIRDEGIDPGPLFLRDTMITVAALLHLECEKIDTAQFGHANDRNHANRAFAQAARERFKAVLEADAVRATLRH